MGMILKGSGRVDNDLALLLALQYVVRSYEAGVVLYAPQML